jgi:hypothetical protein
MQWAHNSIENIQSLKDIENIASYRFQPRRWPEKRIV